MNFSKHLFIQLSFGLGLIFCGLNSCESQNKKIKKSPNILFAIADDQSYPHAGVYGFSEINTPGFDYVANSGVLFHNAFVAAPQCSPSRAAILTGKNIWELEITEISNKDANAVSLENYYNVHKAQNSNNLW